MAHKHSDTTQHTLVIGIKANECELRAFANERATEKRL